MEIYVCTAALMLFVWWRTKPHVDLGCKLDAVFKLQRKSYLKLKSITMNIQELETKLGDVLAKVTKIGTETEGLKGQVASLRAALDEAIAANQSVPESIVAAVASVEAQLQVVDDLVADAPVETPATEEPATETPATEPTSDESAG